MFLYSKYDDGEIGGAKPMTEQVPSSSSPIALGDIGHGVNVIGMTEFPLGTVCCIKGIWDEKLRSKRGWLFRVLEVNGKQVEGVTWSQSEVVIHNFATGEDVTIHESRKKYRGEEWTILGCEIGEYEGLPPEFPSGGGQELRPGGFYTKLVFLKDCD